MTTISPTRAHHQRYLSYLTRFEYFGRVGMVRLTFAKYSQLLTEAAALEGTDPSRHIRAREIRAAILED